MKRQCVVAAVLLALSAVGCHAAGVSAASEEGQTGEEKAAVTLEVQPADGCVQGRESAPDWYRGAVFYEVFVRSFRDSDGDGVGDLRGLIEKLDYLNDGDPTTTDDLGVEALWLMPIFESPSYHGYDTVDYDAVDREYGTSEDLKLLLTEAHRRGIRVIVDLVANHTSWRHPWFLEAADPASPRRDWYVWSDVERRWDRPWGPGPTWHRSPGGWYYALFWKGMPDLNYRTPAVRKEMTRLALKWLDFGVDGFRLDAVRYLVETGGGAGQSDTPETHAYWKELRAAVSAAHPEAFLIGEAWTKRPEMVPYVDGDEMHAAFDFDLAAAIKMALRMHAPTALRDELCKALKYTPDLSLMGTFLANHDMVRFANSLDRDPDLMRLAAAVLLTLPGTPFLYYGEEIGLPNGPQPRDEDKRQPMRWDATPGVGFTSGTPWQPAWEGEAAPDVAAQAADAGSSLNHYRRFVQLRTKHPALRRGSTALLDAHPWLLAMVRRSGGERMLVVHNFSRETTAEYRVDGDDPRLGGPVAATTALVGPAAQVVGGTVVVPPMAPHTSVVLRLEGP